ncbi:hypothetical protein DM860_007418 [Cuscuta australis]|uniref:GRPD C-terminal domain-containing protein n=1 Tax=Cuscuta australis TaxID=267555 RepID=A0A328E560_9ASTE|nr:hypothetical protein DM860_007418 [Cuscuta australis]
MSAVQEDLLEAVSKQRFWYAKFREPYYSEIVHLIAAGHRYKGFLYMVHRFADNFSRLVPTSDILLMWLIHKQSYPTVYAYDTRELVDELSKVVGTWEAVNEVEIEETKKLWERIFEQPYERAGGEIAIGNNVNKVNPLLQWEVLVSDVNAKYKSLLPRFLLELCIMVKLSTKTPQCSMLKEFLRVGCVRSHKELKLDTPLSNFSSQTWQKAFHLYCEFGTKGTRLELRKQSFIKRGSSLTEEAATFLWNDLLRSRTLSLVKEFDKKVRVVASITPPVQAPYLLKCVPDRVTDDSGAMISDVILRMNHYRPQEGRWLSRTVLDHAGRECFVIRIRIGGGFWRRGAERPSAVKWEERIIEVREGCWSYVADSIGKAPVKILGMATPKEAPEGCHALWNFSTGDELSVQHGLPNNNSGFSFCLTNQQSQYSKIKLVEGRKMGYETFTGRANDLVCDEEEDESGFLTVVRFSEDDPTGKATALLHWRLLTLEFSPEEDAVFLLLLCMSIAKSVSKIKKEDAARLLVRRRIKEAKFGNKDWGSVVIHPSYLLSSHAGMPHVWPWQWHAKAVTGPQEIDYVSGLSGQATLAHSQVEGSDDLYKHGIMN